MRGEAIVTRQAGLMTGSALVALSNGRRGQFVFGDLTYNQAFGQVRMQTRSWIPIGESPDGTRVGC
ncbi:hypothetical protein VQ03_00795 [Methylobacterium tarhaniae]|uniref:Uncharacterized protein n=1 Tax=Methylobacterium tarhaniae TaxID=1187852 RepID=A0A0J6TG08_9HYPH|nr:hypothetical protein VQ03_00795 [Methylobacterium tarhaniae]